MHSIELILLISNIYIILFYVQYFLNNRSQKLITSMVQRFKQDKVEELKISSDFRVFYKIFTKPTIGNARP